MLSRKKSQAAMEFLMTYGWAIMVVLIVLAALIFFGIMNVDNFLPDTAEIEPGLLVVSQAADENTIGFVIMNNKGVMLRDFILTVDECNNGEGAFSIPPVNIPPGKSTTVGIYCGETAKKGSKFKSGLRAEYSTQAQGTSDILTHVKEGKVTVTVNLGTYTFADEYKTREIGPNSVLDEDFTYYKVTGTGGLDPFDTCFTISASNIVLDMQGEQCLGSNATSKYGIHVMPDVYNVDIIRGPNIPGYAELIGYEHGIFLEDNNTDILIDKIKVVGNKKDGIHIHSGTNIMLSDVKADGNGDNGIFIDPSKSVTLTSIEASYNGFDAFADKSSGVYIENSDENTIYDLDSYGNKKHALYLKGSKLNSFTDLLVIENLLSGIMLEDSDKSTFDDLIIQSSGGDGVRLVRSSENNFTMLSSSDNTGYGVNILDDSDNNKFDGLQGNLNNGNDDGAGLDNDCASCDFNTIDYKTGEFRFKSSVASTLTVTSNLPGFDDFVIQSGLSYKSINFFPANYDLTWIASSYKPNNTAHQLLESDIKDYDIIMTLQPGTFIANSDIAGATFYTRKQGTTPWISHPGITGPLPEENVTVEVESGTYELKWTILGYDDYVTTETVGIGDVKYVSGAMSELPAKVSVTCNVEGCAFKGTLSDSVSWIEYGAVGTSAQQFTLTHANYNFSCTKDHYYNDDTTVDFAVVRGQTKSVSCDLSPHMATVTLDSLPDGANVKTQIDGESWIERGLTPQLDLALRVGTYNISWSKNKYYNYTNETFIDVGTHTFNATLEGKPGTFNVTSNVAANVFVRLNSTTEPWYPNGTSPVLPSELHLSWPPGCYDFKWTQTNYYDLIQTNVCIGAEDVVDVFGNLQHHKGNFTISSDIDGASFYLSLTGQNNWAYICPSDISPASYRVDAGINYDLKWNKTNYTDNDTYTNIYLPENGVLSYNAILDPMPGKICTYSVDGVIIRPKVYGRETGTTPWILLGTSPLWTGGSWDPCALLEGDKYYDFNFSLEGRYDNDTFSNQYIPINGAYTYSGVQLEKHKGRFEATSNPAGATFSTNNGSGWVLGCTSTPCTTPELLIGNYQLKWELVGYYDNNTQSATLTEGRLTNVNVSVDATLKAQKGNLSITSFPSHAAFYTKKDGEPSWVEQGYTITGVPIIIELPVGTYTLNWTKPGYTDKIKSGYLVVVDQTKTEHGVLAWQGPCPAPAECSSDGYKECQSSLLFECIENINGCLEWKVIQCAESCTSGECISSTPCVDPDISQDYFEVKTTCTDYLGTNYVDYCEPDTSRLQEYSCQPQQPGSSQMVCKTYLQECLDYFGPGADCQTGMCVPP